MKDVGLGRIGYLTNPKTMRDVIEIVKKRFNMKTFRVALANGKSLGMNKVLVMYLVLVLALAFNFLWFWGF